MKYERAGTKENSISGRKILEELGNFYLKKQGDINEDYRD